MPRIAFYDLDGTLCSSNVVERYAFFARHQPSKARAILKCSKLVVGVPVMIGLDFYSRRLFNEVFYREYRGLRHDWLRGLDERLFERVIQPSIYPGAKAMVEADRAKGFLPVLVTGELDFALGPVARYFGFEAVISNALVYQNGAATGEVQPPLIAEGEKVEAMKRLCREQSAELAESKAYSDSFSDTPMLESVGHPVAVNPDRRLKRVAVERGWPILELKKRAIERGNNGHAY
ncbi:MAG TPA: HAD family phosphatase [Terriglobia bacterium]|nr:HAD family phosphatase [Terriglobia bacterium]